MGDLLFIDKKKSFVLNARLMYCSSCCITWHWPHFHCLL